MARRTALTSVLLVSLGVASVASAAGAQLDGSFGGHGKVTTRIGAGSGTATDVVIAKSGRILVAGGTGHAFAVARYLRHGALDRSFGGDGTVVTDTHSGGGDEGEGALAVALTPAGRILAAGGNYRPQEQAVLVRYLRNGTRDRSFGVNGIVRLDGQVFTDVAVQDDGRVVAVGNAPSVLARYRRNGSPDPSFGSDGRVTTDFRPYSVALAPDGKIVVGGFVTPGECDAYCDVRLVVARFKRDGALDRTFSENGEATGALRNLGCTCIGGIALQGDGRIVVSAQHSGNVAVLRFEPDGRLDRSFGGDGRMLVKLPGQPNAVAVLPSEKIVVALTLSAGKGEEFAVLRLKTDGRRDRTFGRRGLAVTCFNRDCFGSAAGIAAQSNGKTVSTGRGGLRSAMFATARYLAR